MYKKYVLHILLHLEYDLTEIHGTRRVFSNFVMKENTKKIVKANYVFV